MYPQTFGASLADDFQRWGEVVLGRMQQEIGDLYPSVQIPKTVDVSHQTQLFGGGDPQLNQQAEPTAYIWARTVPCRRPGCGAPVRCPSSVAPEETRAVAAVPRIEDGNRLCWDIVSGSSTREIAQRAKQTGAGQAVCVVCNAPVPSDYVKEMSKTGHLVDALQPSLLMAGGPSCIYHRGLRH